jgi:hypothetical protein
MSYQSIDVTHAMDEETLSIINNAYHFWDRDVSLTKYQINRIAIDGGWDTLLILLKHLPYERSSNEYRDVISYTHDLLNAFGMHDLRQRIPQSNIPYRSPNIYDTVITPGMIDDIQINLTMGGNSISLSDLASSRINPIVIEHTYQWWNLHDDETLESIVYDIYINPADRLAIAYGMRIPINDDIINT